MPNRKIVLIVGARPNYMKAAPILAAAQDHGLDVCLVHTGQHYDRVLNELLFEELGLPEPQHKLTVGKGRNALEQIAAVLTALPAVIEQEQAEMVVVVGDVNSTLAGSLVAARTRSLPMPLAHVEAGLRSGDRTMPEELNRLCTDQLADLLLCSEPSGVEHLQREGRDPAGILLVGNTMIDTLLRLRPRAAQGDALRTLGLEARGYGLVTLHRPSNVDDPQQLQGLLDALGTIGERLPLVFPVHPRTRSKLEALRCPATLWLVDPLGYLEFVQLMDHSRLMLTDSGGIQEETTVLGVPCLTIRANTERPVTIDQGTNTLVGVRPDDVVRHALAALDAPSPEPSRPPLWDGRAGERIAAALAGYLAGGPAEARRRAVTLGATGPSVS
jgi:UDP-N-acetylglucosamine 2-epimerase (non-hydrolysing)